MNQACKLSADMIHVLEVVFALQPDSILHHVVAHESYKHPLDFLHESDDTFDILVYPDEAGTLTKIPEYGAYLLKAMKHFVAFQNSQHISYNANYWMNITQLQFNSFLTAHASILSPVQATSLALTSNVRPSSVNEISLYRKS